MNNRSLTISDADSITDSIVQYSGIEGEFERVRPITDFRKDDTEARILYVYKRKYGEKREAHQSTGDHFYVLKCKVQYVFRQIHIGRAFTIPQSATPFCQWSGRAT